MANKELPRNTWCYIIKDHRWHSNECATPVLPSHSIMLWYCKSHLPKPNIMYHNNMCIYWGLQKSCSYSVSYVYPRPRVCTKIVYFVSSSTRMVYTVGFRFKVCWVLFRSFFMFSNFCRLDLHNKTHIALVDLRWNIYNNRDWKSDLPCLIELWLSEVRVCCFLNWIRRSSHLCSLLGCRVVIDIFEDVTQSLLNMWSW